MTPKKSRSGARSVSIGNALAQFLILSSLACVAFQFLTTRSAGDATAAGGLAAGSTTRPSGSSLASPSSSPSPTPWSDAALERHRAEREAMTTTEFSCFLACVGIVGLMHRNQRIQEQNSEDLDQAQRHTPLFNAPSERKHAATQSQGMTMVTAATEIADLPLELRLELYVFLSPRDLINCAMVNKAWHRLTGDSADALWESVFERDFAGDTLRLEMVFPRLCWRQYYFQHHLSRAVELARYLELAAGRKCVVVEGLVYDVTDFIDVHPGGHQILGDVIGTDASDLWHQFQHSREAREQMQDFIVEDDILMKVNLGEHPFGMNGNLATVRKRWRKISWCLAHAALFGGFANTFVDYGVRFIHWRAKRKLQQFVIAGCEAKK